MKKTINALILLLAITYSASAVITVDVGPMPDYDLFMIGDLDPSGELGQVANEITFTFELTPPGDYYVEFLFSFENVWIVNGYLSGEDVSYDSGESFTLNQIRNNTANLPAGFDSGGEFNEDFVSHISGNSLPAGTYKIEAFVYDFQNSVKGSQLYYDSDDFSFQDPRNIFLDTPYYGEIVANSFPDFSWNGLGSRYHIKVCAFDPESHGSYTDALEAQPVWENEEVFGHGTPYGVGGDVALPLMEGTTYVWAVWAVLNTTSGEREYRSDIRSFIYSEGGSEYDQTSIENLLVGLTPGQLAGLVEMLQGFSLDGPITLNGEVISLEEFAELIRRLADGELNIASMRVE
jgi:hypothetical protein